MSPYQIQILYAFQFLFTPFGLLAMATFLLLLMLTLILRRFKWFVFSLMLFTASLSLHTDVAAPTLIFPLEQIRTEGRTATVALMTIVIFSLLMLARGWRRKYFVPGLAMFLVFQIILSLNLAFRGDFTRGSVGLLLNLYEFFLFAVAIPHGLQLWDDVIDLVRGIAGFGVVFAGLNLIQIIFKPSAVLTGGRFTGTTGNAQFVGQICAMGLVAVCYLIVRPGKVRFERLILGATGASLLLMLTWSGSRTGAMMAIVGMGLLFAVFALLATRFIFPEKEVISAHLFYTTNTRAQVWHNLLAQFISSPIVGIMRQQDYGYGESSYLSVASNLGLMGLIPFILSLAMIGWSLYKLWRLREIFADQLLVDLVIAMLLQTAFGAFFEAYLMGIVSATLMTAMGYLPILAYLLESAEMPEALDEPAALEAPPPEHLPAGAW